MAAIASILSYQSENPIDWEDQSTVGIEEPEPLYLGMPQNHHMFFDEDGNEITHEQFLQLQEEEESWAFGYRLNGHNYIFRHPTALLSFFRFIDSMNSFAEWDETVFLRPIEQEMYSRMIDHPYFNTTTEEVQELLTYLAHNTELV